MRSTVTLALSILFLVSTGCLEGGDSALPDLCWGELGTGNGQLKKPRAMAIDSEDRLYLVDMTARVQVFDAEGNFLHGWQTPTHKNGRPSGLTIAPNGDVLVADTHYYRLLRYTSEGKLLEEKTIGGELGHEPGQFGFVTDGVEDSQGNLYIAEYGEFDRIQKFSRRGEYLLEWGSHGSAPGQFIRPQNLAIDDQDRIWVADACNHRIQVFDSSGKLLFLWGKQGKEPGALSYPYDLTFDREGNLVVCEFGNHRVQKFTPEGRSLGCWGTHGRDLGQLFNPWALGCDSLGRVHILDTNNHRVQRIYF